MDKLSHLKNLLTAELGNEFKGQIDIIVDRTVKFMEENIFRQTRKTIPLVRSDGSVGTIILPEPSPLEDALSKLDSLLRKSGLTNEDPEEEKNNTFLLARSASIQSFKYRIIDYPDKKEHWELCISELENITFESIRAKYNL